MPLMDWSEKLSVGIPSIDAQHKKLVGMLNELFDGAQSGHAKEILGKILAGLIEYTASHFAYEEQLFAKHGYAESAAHKAEHDALAKQVIEVQTKYNAGASAALSMEVMTFLKNWLNKHIQGSDKKYTAFLVGHGVK